MWLISPTRCRKCTFCSSNHYVVCPRIWLSIEFLPGTPSSKTLKTFRQFLRFILKLGKNCAFIRCFSITRCVGCSLEFTCQCIFSKMLSGIQFIHKGDWVSGNFSQPNFWTKSSNVWSFEFIRISVMSSQKRKQNSRIFLNQNCFQSFLLIFVYLQSEAYLNAWLLEGIYTA